MAGARPDPAEEAADDDVVYLPATPDLDDASALALLRDGRLELIGRLVASSNNALLGTVTLPTEESTRGGEGTGAEGSEAGAGAEGSEAGAGAEGREARVAAEPIVAPCVYKPIRGERPLWDFPDGTLAAREVAAYVVSAATPWAVVPPTVLRDGPFGEGMVQLWIHPDEAADAVAMVVEGDRRLRPMALFDVVVNNADRKVGHLLPMPDGRVHGVDHGICFNEEPKLRTVLWHWRGDRLTDGELAVLRGLRADLAGGLGMALAPLLTARELAATEERVHELLAHGRFPHPDPDRPAIPWPPY